MSVMGAVEYPCSECGAAAGQQCREGRQPSRGPCRARLEAAGFALPRKAGRRKLRLKAGNAYVQQTLWEDQA